MDPPTDLRNTRWPVLAFDSTEDKDFFGAQGLHQMPLDLDANSRGSRNRDSRSDLVHTPETYSDALLAARGELADARVRSRWLWLNASMPGFVGSARSGFARMGRSPRTWWPVMKWSPMGGQSKSVLARCINGSESRWAWRRWSVARGPLGRGSQRRSLSHGLPTRATWLESPGFAPGRWSNIGPRLELQSATRPLNNQVSHRDNMSAPTRFWPWPVPTCPESAPFDSAFARPCLLV